MERSIAIQDSKKTISNPVDNLILVLGNSINGLPPIKGYRVVPDILSAKLFVFNQYSYILPFYLEKIKFTKVDELYSDFSKLGFIEKTAYFLCVEIIPQANKSNSDLRLVDISISMGKTFWESRKTQGDNVIPEFNNIPGTCSGNKFCADKKSGLDQISKFISKSFVDIACKRNLQKIKISFL